MVVSTSLCHTYTVHTNYQAISMSNFIMCSHFLTPVIQRVKSVHRQLNTPLETSLRRVLKFRIIGHYYGFFTVDQVACIEVLTVLQPEVDESIAMLRVPGAALVRALHWDRRRWDSTILLRSMTFTSSRD